MQIPTGAELFTRAQAQAPIVELAPILGDFGAAVYLVGGTVRDLILGRRFIDVDLALEGDPMALAAELGTATGVETRFGTLSAYRAGYRYDLARTRSERYLHAGALPEVEPAGIEVDLERRDFTVNALALGLTGSRAGDLLAVPGALEDLERGRLAVLHDASFLDDPTRLLRLARYSARLGFAIAPHTGELAARAITADALGSVSGTRIGNELRLLAGEPDPVAGFEAVEQLGLSWKIDAQLTRKALAVLPEDGRADLVVLACVFGEQPYERLVAELDRLGFTAADREVVAEAATEAEDLARRLSNATSRSDIANTVGTARIETVALAACKGAPSQSLTWLRELRHLNIQISGDDLIQHGIPEGPAVGQALRAAREAMMDGAATNRESQLRVALEAAE